MGSVITIVSCESQSSDSSHFWMFNIKTGNILHYEHFIWYCSLKKLLKSYQFIAGAKRQCQCVFVEWYILTLHYSKYLQCSWKVSTVSPRTDFFLKKQKLEA